MILKKITLLNFRNFKKQEFVFNPRLTIAVGENSRGKTNLIEAVYFVLKGSGFREKVEEELVNLDEKAGRVTATFVEADTENIFEIDIKRVDDKAIKTFFIDRTAKKPILYKNELPSVVLFTPDQINIIKGAPALRRKYFDDVMSNRDLDYQKHLNNFENALRRRNRILEKHINPKSLGEELEFWNTYLEKEAKHITEKRNQYVEYLNKNRRLDSKMFTIFYRKNEFSKKRLEEVFEKERFLRKTLIGPQKDDFQIMIADEKSKKNVHSFGSRSEERLAIFWLKINELKYLEEKGRLPDRQEKPILLLDDIFSELDRHNKKIVLHLITKYQTIASTTEKEFVDSISEEKSIINL